jgi:phosphopantothenoylcysteine synthetase/decarboxylase
MNYMNAQGRPVLYAIVTGSPAARAACELVDLAQADGWDVCMIASPNGRLFIDVDAVEAKTGHPVRSQYKAPDAPDVLPPADAMIAAPVTCNSLAKWAAGISDTLPLGLLVEAVGKGMPVVAVPFSNCAQISFPAVQTAIRNLSAWGVTMVPVDDMPEPQGPGTVAPDIRRLPWERAWRAVLEDPRLSMST